MTDQPMENMDEEQRARERETEILERDQAHKGYGEDEGERDEALQDGEQE